MYNVSIITITCSTTNCACLNNESSVKLEEPID